MLVGHQPSFDDLSTPLFDVTFCVLDLETTGGSAASCEMTEIGAVRYRRGELLGTFQTLVDPGVPIPPFITVLTGITTAMVTKAPPVAEALPSFLEFIGDAVVVGHNVRFDVSFIEAAAARLGYGPLANPRVDTAALARRLIRPEVRNLRLGTLARHLRSPVTPTHRALDDARATAHVLHALLERAGTIGVTSLDDLLALPRARGSAHFSKIRLTDSLPRRPGVYLFKDRDGTPIYVGKAADLRARVRQYFYGDDRRSVANMMSELDGIDHVECPTELEASITELRLIHAHRPRHNRRSRPPKSPHYVKLTSEAFPRLSIVRSVREDGLAYLGPFRSRRAAAQAADAILDATPLRRCRGRPGSRSAACAPAQMGQALCPCDGRLRPERYRDVVARVEQGLSSRPEMLLDPLTDRIRKLASERRFEEAGVARDRRRSLVGALRKQAAWATLSRAGWIEVEDPSGTRVLVDHGRLAGSCPPGSRLPLTPDPGAEPDPPAVPPDVLAGEEAWLIWRWMCGESLRIIDVTGTLASPSQPIVDLKSLAA